jgi:hypothetical protein
LARLQSRFPWEGRGESSVCPAGEKSMVLKEKDVDEKEFENKYASLKILKGIHEYLKPEGKPETAVYPIRVPEDLVYQMLKLQGPKHLDSLIHSIFRIGLSVWSEKLYRKVFGSEKSLEEFVDELKKGSGR